jgi:hypothetical protein
MGVLGHVPEVLERQRDRLGHHPVEQETANGVDDRSEDALNGAGLPQGVPGGEGIDASVTAVKPRAAAARADRKALQ